MRRAALVLLTAALAILAFAPHAQAAFGLQSFDVRFLNEDGTPATQAGSHPFAMETFFEINNTETEPGIFFPDGGDIRDLIFEQAKGLIGSATAVPRCSTIDFVTINPSTVPSCPDNTAVGATAALLTDPSTGFAAAVFNLVPPPGVPVRLGFAVQEVPVVIDIGLKQSPDYNVVGGPKNTPQPLTVFGSAFQLWGTPSDPAHDFARGECVLSALNIPREEMIIEGKLNLVDLGGPECSAEGAPEEPLLTLPRACDGPLSTVYEMRPWDDPTGWVRGSIPTGPFTGCGKLEFDPEIASDATTDSAGTGSGLDFEIDFEDEADPGHLGLTDPDGLAQSEIKESTIALPPGVTVNPSLAEGLGVCTPADLDRETLAAAPGAGCPDASKIGTIEVQTPLLDRQLEGSVFLAQQNDPTASGKENPFDSLIAFYIVIKNQDLGVLVKVPAKVAPDPLTGQLVTTVNDIPQTPFTRLRFHFHEGQRAPLITPPTCGTHTTVATFTPWARPTETLTETASFQITRGVGGGPCPPGGVPPFNPGFEAGSLNNNAASYSPFLMRLTRSDGEQDMTKFSQVLPPGVVGKLAGVSKCSETQIRRAKAKSGRQELAAPSCPANSLIGHTTAGAGVGSALTYVGGKLYLAGPYKGAPLSVVAVTPAVAGPFDVGTVVVRVGLDVNPRTAEVEVKGAASDPIPHILQGIPLSLRDLRISVDRRNFTLNPTSCDESSTKATLFGSFLDVIDPADDRPVSLSSRFQAANCSRLGFKPRVNIRLKGGTRRGAFPKLHLVYRPRPGDANLERLALRFPRSEFIEQGHFRTICTRVQFAAGAGHGTQCPKGSVYGRVKVFTPILSEPLTGPVFLRSSSHNLPDVVLALHGPPGFEIDLEVATRIDSINGGLRAIAQSTPDAPVSKAVVDMQGGQKGLFVNSTNLCSRKHRARVALDGHNGKRSTIRPLMGVRCSSKRR